MRAVPARAFQFVISAFRTARSSRPTNLHADEMEGSMKMMSWSRYHCLSWSFTRIRARLRHETLVRAGHKITTRAVSTPGAEGAAPGRRRHRSRPLNTPEQGVGFQSESDPRSGCFEPKRGHAIPMSDRRGAVRTRLFRAG